MLKGGVYHRLSAAVSAAEFAKESLNLYPNPAINSITIQSDELNLNEVELTLTDMTGRIIETSHSIDENGELKVDCLHLRQGNYLIMITDDALNRYVLKFSKL